MNAPLRHANDAEPLDDCWIPLSFAAAAVLANITDAEARTDFEAMATIEGGPVQTVDVPGAGGDA